jgi:hypothetical protein
MQTAEQVMTEITEKAKASVPTIRRVDELVPGKVERQGDIYPVHLGAFTKSPQRISDYQVAIRDAAKPKESTLKALPGCVGKKSKTRQLASGETQGSRHVAVGDEVLVFEPAKDASVLIGPTVASPKRFVIEHPEHGHVDLPAGVYQITYQRDWKREQQEIRRVQD